MIDKDLRKQVRKHCDATYTYGSHNRFYIFEPFADDFRGGYFDVVPLPVFGVYDAVDRKFYTGKQFQNQRTEDQYSL